MISQVMLCENKYVSKSVAFIHCLLGHFTSFILRMTESSIVLLPINFRKCKYAQYAFKDTDGNSGPREREPIDDLDSVRAETVQTLLSSKMEQK